MDRQDVSAVSRTIRAEEMGLGSVGRRSYRRARPHLGCRTRRLGDERAVASRRRGSHARTSPISVATAIANAQARSELAASRARIVTAADRRASPTGTRPARRSAAAAGLAWPRIAHGGGVAAVGVQSDVADQLSEIVAGADRRVRTSCARSPGDPSGDPVEGRTRACAQGASHAARRCRSSSTSPSTAGCRSRSRWPRISWSAESLTNVARHAQATDGEGERRYRRRGPAVDDSRRRRRWRRPRRTGQGSSGSIDRVEALGGQIRVIQPRQARGRHWMSAIPFEAPVHGLTHARRTSAPSPSAMVGWAQHRIAIASCTADRAIIAT